MDAEKMQIREHKKLSGLVIKTFFCRDLMHVSNFKYSFYDFILDLDPNFDCIKFCVQVLRL